MAYGHSSGKGPTRRGALTVLLAGVAATAAAITLLPRFLDDFCPFTFMCGDSGKYDELAKLLAEVDDLALGNWRENTPAGSLFEPNPMKGPSVDERR